MLSAFLDLKYHARLARNKRDNFKSTSELLNDNSSVT